MPDRARAAALLSGGGADGYSMRNIEKTTRDFEGLETLPIRPDREMALLALYQSSMSDILVIVFLLFVCVRLFSREYENRLYPLLLATPGRFRVAVHKLDSAGRFRSADYRRYLWHQPVYRRFPHGLWGFKPAPSSRWEISAPAVCGFPVWITSGLGTSSSFLPCWFSACSYWRCLCC